MLPNLQLQWHTDDAANEPHDAIPMQCLLRTDQQAQSTQFYVNMIQTILK